MIVAVAPEQGGAPHERILGKYFTTKFFIEYFGVVQGFFMGTYI